MLRENLLKLIQAAGNIDTSTTASSLVGKAVKHRFEDTRGRLPFFKGRVVSQVPGFPI
jgi:hypothetical protein